MRYLGEIARRASTGDPRLHALKQLAVQEMVSRGFKHVASRYLKQLSAPFAHSCIAHLLNCLIGAAVNPHPTPEVEESLKSLYTEDDFSFENVTPDSLKEEVTAQIQMRYRHELDSAWVVDGREMQMLREVCLKMGFQLEAKEYQFAKSATTNGTTSSSTESLPPPTTNGHQSTSGKKKKRAAEHSPAHASASSAAHQVFHPDDIMNVVPVIKEASPRSVLAEEALEAGRISIAQDQKDLGQELLLESLSLHEQIYGILHPEVARVYYALSTLYYGLEEKNAAVELARKAVIISERTLGVDHAETVLSYLNLSLFEHANGNTKIALAYVRHALDLWKIVYGIKHPDSITTINNAAVMLQSMKQYHESRIWFEASLAICEEVSGKNSVNTATLLFQLAQALALDRDSKGAVKRMREAFTIFRNELGPEDRNTKEAETWLEQLTQSAVSLARHAKDIQNRRVLLRPRAAQTAMGTRPQPQVGQSANESILPLRTTGGADDGRSIDELLKYINGEAKTTPKKKPTNPKRRHQKA